MRFTPVLDTVSTYFFASGGVLDPLGPYFFGPQGLRALVAGQKSVSPGLVTPLRAKKEYFYPAATRARKPRPRPSPGGRHTWAPGRQKAAPAPTDLRRLFGLGLVVFADGAGQGLFERHEQNEAIFVVHVFDLDLV